VKSTSAYTVNTGWERDLRSELTIGLAATKNVKHTAHLMKPIARIKAAVCAIVLKKAVSIFNSNYTVDTVLSGGIFLREMKYIPIDFPTRLCYNYSKTNERSLEEWVCC